MERVAWDLPDRFTATLRDPSQRQAASDDLLLGRLRLAAVDTPRMNYVHANSVDVDERQIWKGPGAISAPSFGQSGVYHGDRLL